MRKRRGIVALAASATVALAVAAAPASAQEIPAPAGAAEAVAAAVEGIIGIGHTIAEAQSGAGTAEANAIELLGTVVVGGKQEGNGNQSGALLDTGEGPIRVEVAPWAADVGDAEGCKKSDAVAALARVTIEGLLGLDVLQSESHAAHCGLTSKGSGSSDGVVLDLAGALKLVLLHSEGESGAKGSTYVAAINDSEILSDEQMGGSCALEVPSLLDLTCLVVTGGQGAAATAAEVADLSALEDAIGVDLVSTTAQQAAAAPAPAGPAEPAPSGGELPTTGADTWAKTVRGIAMVLLGAAMLLVARQRAMNGAARYGAA